MAETAVSTPEETAEKLREEIRKTKKLTEKPFGVNLIPMPENDIWTAPIVNVIKEESVQAVVYTGYGDGSLKPELFNELKDAGIKIIYRDINPTPENTRRAEAAGADIVVATGFDGGGTLPATALGTKVRNNIFRPLYIVANKWLGSKWSNTNNSPPRSASCIIFFCFYHLTTWWNGLYLKATRVTCVKGYLWDISNINFRD